MTFRMDIKTPQGTKVIFIEDMSKFSGEEEVLMNMGSKFIIHDIRIEKRATDKHGGSMPDLKEVLDVERNPLDTDEHVTEVLKEFERLNTHYKY